MNKEELNWLLETIQDARTAERFVSAQYERGRVSSQVMADVARERTEYATTELPVAIA